MIYAVENEQLRIKVNSMGAELRSVVDKKTGLEYMWSGDPTYWVAVSPVLFPFIGVLQDGVYRYEGKKYEMTRHGFAKRTEFVCSAQEENALWFALEDTESTRAEYPFAFRFEAGYVLEGRTIQIKWRVFNRNKKEMYFAIGGHPGFACPPAYQDGKRTECSLLFDKKDSIVSELVNSSGLVSGQKKEFKLEDGKLPITTGLFDIDTILLEDKQVSCISLCDRDDRPYLTVKFDAPTVAIWSVKPDEGSYVCIEPWYGRCDDSGYKGTLEERPWGMKLEPNGSFEAGYEISLA